MRSRSHEIGHITSVKQPCHFRVHPTRSCRRGSDKQRVGVVMTRVIGQCPGPKLARGDREPQRVDSIGPSQRGN
jgi:hypothetical protein